MTEAFILEGEALFTKEGMDPANIYFKLLAQLQVLECKAASHHGALARVNYLIGHYLGLFLHPICGDVLAQSYIEQALRLDPDEQNKETYREALAMIREEL
ncbi:hypothetical protein ABB02_00252 [Clostridiaceae bacterium JG1575]|nr:hypothetical protein ABB02_00252 [Clostridiaceae bacterium JG1575]